jgi:exopolyphosphatase / guanosine-5'-triphosphate,3'-diphosphate pyrophosphatase
MRFEDDGAGGRRVLGLEPLGVVDIGSNSVRFVVYEGAIRAATPLFNEKILCGLGRTLATTGRLEQVGAERALSAMARFHAIARVLSVKNLRAVATAAVRDAADGAEFIHKCEAALGVSIEILTGEREAELAALGIRMGFMEPDGIAGDLGGGSLELVDISKDKVNDAATLPLGGLRLIDTTAGKMERALEITDEQLAKLPWLKRGRGRPFYAVGGSWRSLAKLHMHNSKYPLRIMQGYSVAGPAMQVYCESIRRSKRPADFPGFNEVAKARREALPYGALVMERLIRAMNPSEVVFSVFGIREGLLFSLLPEHERRKDPLLSFCEDFAVLRSRSLEHAHELTRWMDALFTTNALSETAEDKRLREAACLISDIGWRAHPDYRGEQSLNLIAHSGLAGIDHNGRMFLALSIYFRHAEEEEAAGELSQRLRATTDKRTQKRARIVGAAVRTAHMLSIGCAGVIDECPLSYDNNSLVLTLPPAYADLNGERLMRRLESLAQLIDKRAEIRVGA